MTASVVTVSGVAGAISVNGAGVPGLALPAVTGAETDWFRNQAALLDPAAHRFYQATSVSPTLPPAGITVAPGGWFLRNSWYLKSDDATAPVRNKFHRNCGEVTPISAGKVLYSNLTNGFAYVCQPELVIASDARYTSDPKGLYYSRLAQLMTLAQKDATTSPGYTPTTLTAPTSGKCMALLVSQFELTWSMLQKGATGLGINLTDEIDDSANWRRTQAMMMPFNISDFDTLVPGTGYGAQNTPPTVTLTYVELPVGW